MDKLTKRNIVQPTPPDMLAILMRQNQVLKEWGSRMRGLIKGEAQQFKKGKDEKDNPRVRPSPTGPLVKKFPGIKFHNEYILRTRINTSYRKAKNTDIYESLSFTFQRHGVFVHKGVGRGYQMINGKVVRTAKNPLKEGSLGRVPQDWFNKVIDANTNTLANKVAEVNADAAVNALRMKIN